MAKRRTVPRRLIGLVLSLALVAPDVAAQTPTVDHAGVGCIAADGFPIVEARISPAESVSRARVYFRASGSAPWYFVDMTSDGAAHRGTLPKPQRTTAGIDYYVEALDRELRPGRTAEFHPRVVAHGAECSEGAALAAAVGTAKVAVGAVTPGSGLPAGFASGGLTLASGGTAPAAAAGATAAAAGGGVSTALIVGLAAAGAAGVGVAVAAGGGDDGSPSAPGGPSGGTSPILLAIQITSPGSVPHIDVSECAGTSVTFGGGNVSLRADGTFDETWSPMTPNTLRLMGRADATSLQASLSCASRPGPTGTMNATGSDYNMSGSFSFGSQRGTLTVRRAQ